MFALATLRRPIRPELGNLIQAAIGLAVLAFVASYPLITIARLPPVLAIVLAELAGLALLAALVWSDHAPHPAGALRIEGGRLRFDAWRGAPVDVPITDVRKAMIVEYRDHRPAALVIWLGARKRILVHAPRLAPGVSLDDVLRAIDAALEDAGVGPEVRAASARTLRAEQQRQRLLAVGVVVLAVLALLRALLSG